MRRSRTMPGAVIQKWLMAAGMLPLFLFCGTAGTGLAEESNYDYHHGLGVLDISSQSPAQSLRMSLPMVVPGDIETGWKAHVHSTWTNVWAKDNEFLLDYEMLNTMLALTYGFDEHFGLSVAFDNRNYFGGEMDAFIQEFHDTFGISQNGRDAVPKNRNVVQLFDPQTGEMLSEIPAHELNNNRIDLLLNYNITDGTQIWPSVNLYGVASYPLNSPEMFEDDDQADFGFGLGFAKRWSERWYAYAVVAFSVYDNWEVRESAADVKPLEFEDEKLSCMFSLSWHYTPTFALLAQYLYNEPDINNIDELDKPSHEVHLGFKWEFGGNNLIEFALIENIINYDNSPDFGLHMGWNYLF